MPSRKPTCDYKKETTDKCNQQVQRIVGDCGFCGGHFCSKHRLLESHSCPNLEDCKKESYEQNASKLIAERTVAIKGV
jgi:predicted nucleic acid binding AN1-type Zn finger protein